MGNCEASSHLDILGLSEWPAPRGLLREAGAPYPCVCGDARGPCPQGLTCLFRATGSLSRAFLSFALRPMPGWAGAWALPAPSTPSGPPSTSPQRMEVFFLPGPPRAPVLPLSHSRVHGLAPRAFLYVDGWHRRSQHSGDGPASAWLLAPRTPMPQGHTLTQ